MNNYIITYIIPGLVGSTTRAEMKVIVKAGTEDEARRIFRICFKDCSMLHIEPISRIEFEKILDLCVLIIKEISSDAKKD